MSDTRDLTNDEVAALEPWQRVAFFIQPFNRAGLRFANAQEWAEWASILRHETAEELIDEHECLTEFVERENAALRAELEGVRKDTERLLWMTADHDDVDVRERVVNLCNRLPTMSISAVRMYIDAAIAQGKGEK